MTGIFVSPSHDPWFNLAVEQYLLETAAESRVILYLWQNENTVVIGKNQNPWKECKTALLQEEGGKLARRLSGGGAVFHDLGNLNFTFLMPQSAFDLTRQFSVILDALAQLGVEARFSGRNDIEAGGRKFSGNAFYKNGKQAYHHGTLLVDADLNKLNRYLSPTKAKLQSKGVDSVRSRVVNLRELNPLITIEALKQALAAAFARQYGAPEEILLGTADMTAVEKLAQRNGSWEWLYGQKVPFSCECEGRFSWGGVQLLLQVEYGVIHGVKAYSDAMDWRLPAQLEQALTGCRFEKAAMQDQIRSAGLDVAADICELLSQLD